MFYKRLLAVLILVVTVFFASCVSSPVPENNEREILKGFSVHYLDVGQGDAIFIKLNDGKHVLIDCAEPTDRNKEYIKDFLSSYGVTVIDYFIITHPDSDHIANAPFILENFTVKELYLSNLNANASQYFPIYKQVESLAKEKQITVEYNDNFKVIKGEDYYFAFLTPHNKTNPDSSYASLNGALIPDSAEVNNISPIIYFECAGLRFIFTGDAGASQEKLAVTIPLDPLFETHFKSNGITPNIYDVDFLKIGHHGSEQSSCKEFLEVLKPKNAVISVSGNNYYGMPSSKVLDRLFTANPDCNLYRTDVHGTISIGIENNQIKIVTDLNE